MIQKTYETRELKESGELFRKLREDPDYQNAGTRVVEILVECWEEEELRRISREAGESLPEAVIVGMTNFYTYWVPEVKSEKPEPRVGVSALLFRDAEVRLVHIPVPGEEEDLSGGALNAELIRIPELKAVQIFACGSHMLLDELSRTASKGIEEIPIFGTKAAVDFETYREGFLFTGEGVLPAGNVLALAFSGKELFVRTSYNLGWTPIGKEMTITHVTGEYLVDRIDGEPATEIYRKYLGLSPEQIIVKNTSEFPVLFNHGGWLVARTGAEHRKNGEIEFSAPVQEGEVMRFSYGNPGEIFRETFEDSRAIEYGCAEGLLIVACGNRQLFLGEEEECEIDFYREVCPQLLLIHGNSEFLLSNGAGGELNSALITLAFREGEALHRPDKVRLKMDEKKSIWERESVPLVQRLLKFLEATTGELSEMAKAARAASEAKTTFISNMSHEIRTPINSVLGLDEMILRETTEPEIRRYAEDIKVAGRTLLSLINDILDMSRIESGKLTIVPVEYELSSALNDLVNMIGVRAREKKLDFIVNVDPKMPHLLFGDDTRIKQCALNILTNAVKYTQEGSVTMDVGFDWTDEENGFVTFRVRDTGIGIREEDMQRLFSRFERIEEKRNRTIEGTGLGMSIVRQLLALMGSELQVSSVYGEGSDFSFRVQQRVVSREPIGNFAEMYERSLENAERYQESFHAPEARVLVVDDTRMNLTVFTSLLKGTRLKIDTADSGFQALELVRQQAYDVIFLDQRMPEMDGTETLKRMKELPENRNSDTPVIMLTANAVSGAREQFLSAGFDEYLPKPINGVQLEKLLLKYLPPEKVFRRGTKEYGEDGQERDESALTEKQRRQLAMLRQIPEIQYQKALENCMKEEILLDAVAAFTAAAKTGPEEIEELLRTGDLRNYTVKVHALKSSSRIIGAEELSRLAAELEERGDAGDAAELREKTPSLLRMYRRLSGALTEIQESMQEEEEESLPEIPAEELQSAYAGISELAEAFDFDGAGDILAMLEEYRLPQEERERFQKLKDAVVKLDRDMVLALLEEN